MPQMSPLSWTTLMITFILMLILINSMMYFNKTYSSVYQNKKNSVNNINWKW